jgi:hypothetical protein
MKHLNSILRRALQVLLIGAAGPVLAQTSLPSCYPSDISHPTQSGVTVGLVDMTTFREPSITRDFRSAFLKAASQPGQRVVLLTFSGLARGQNLVHVIDSTVEAPVTDEETVANARIGPFKASQRCVQQRHKEHVTKLTAALNETLNQPVSSVLERSEIIHALRTVIADFGDAPMRLMVLSDGWQHNKEISFYTGGKPRAMNAKKELKSVERAYHLGSSSQQIKVTAADTKVLWWGLMTTENPKFYADPKQLDELGGFWRSLLARWGVAEVQIGNTLNNPKL